MENNIREHKNIMTARTLFNIAGIINIIFGVFLLITIVGIIFGALLIYSGMILLKYKNMSIEELNNNSQNILTWGLVLLFVDIVAGICTLIAFTLISCTNPDEGKVEKVESSSFNELEKAYDLLSKGIITEEEYEEIKNKILY